MNKIPLPWFILLLASVSAFATIHRIDTESALRGLSACA